MYTDTKIYLTVLGCVTTIVAAICVGTINGQNRTAEVRRAEIEIHRAEIEAGCKVVGGGEVRVLQ